MARTTCIIFLRLIFKLVAGTGVLEIDLVKVNYPDKFIQSARLFYDHPVTFKRVQLSSDLCAGLVACPVQSCLDRFLSRIAS